MPKEIDTSDWNEAFRVASRKITRVGPADGHDGMIVRREDVAEAVAISEGENNGEDWLGVFKLKDGRYVLIVAWCEIYGWSYRADGSAILCGTLDGILNSLSDHQHRRLDFGLR